MISFRENFGQIFSSNEGSVNSDDRDPAMMTKSSWPNVAAQGFTMDNVTNSSSSLLWDDKTESPPVWAAEKYDSPLWDTDPSSTWDPDLSHQLATKLLMLDDQPSTASQVLEQHMFGHHNPSYFGHGQDLTMASAVANPRFKTEICRNFKEKGTCLYGELCQFAHGKHELRKDVVRHNKYKTKLCQKYWIAGYCAYGPRCNFIHQEKEGLANLANIQKQELPMQMITGFANHSTLYKNAFDVIGLDNARKSSLGDSGDSGSDDAGNTKMRGFQVPIFVPREKKMQAFQEKVNQLGYGRDVGLGSPCGGAGPVGSGRPGQRVWPGA